MPNVESAEQATEIAVSFLKNHNYHRFMLRPLSAKMDQGKWVVEVDVGAFFARIAKMIVDVETGRILEYQVPPSPFPPPPPGLPQI